MMNTVARGPASLCTPVPAVPSMINVKSGLVPVTWQVCEGKRDGKYAAAYAGMELRLRPDLFTPDGAMVLGDWSRI